MSGGTRGTTTITDATFYKILENSSKRAAKRKEKEVVLNTALAKGTSGYLLI